MEVIGIKKIVDDLPSQKDVVNPRRRNRLQEILKHYRYPSSSEDSTVSNICSSDDENINPMRPEERKEQKNQMETIDAYKNHRKLSPKTQWEYFLAGTYEPLEVKTESPEGKRIDFNAENQRNFAVSNTGKSTTVHDIHYLKSDESSSVPVQKNVTYSNTYPFVRDVKRENPTDVISEFHPIPSCPSIVETTKLVDNSANPSSPPVFFYMVRPSSKAQNTPADNEVCLNANDSSPSSSSCTSSETDSETNEPCCTDSQVSQNCDFIFN